MVALSAAGGYHARVSPERLAGFKVPRQFLMSASLPRNPYGRVFKPVLRDESAAEDKA